jgi:hypothetical protein
VRHTIPYNVVSDESGIEDTVCVIEDTVCVIVSDISGIELLRIEVNLNIYDYI